MKSNKLKKLCAVALTLALGMSIFTGCGSSDQEGYLIYNLGEDPKTIDPALNTSTGAGTIIDNAFEGLMRLDENEKAKPGVAKSYEVSDDKLVYTFHLRDNAKWSDGEPVTAKDFEYAWVRALTKETASEYAYQLYYIKNAEKFNKGEATREELGIEVVDEYTLKVTLEAPTPYFLELTAFTTYLPVRQDIVEANPDGWALEPETYVSNGPFTLTGWDLKEQLVFKKNENYWNASEIKLPGLVYKLVTDENTAYASLKSGEFDMVDSVPPAEIASGQEEGLVTISPNLGTYSLIFNLGRQSTLSEDVKKVLNNAKVRKALAIAIDRKGLVENVTKGGQIPAYSYVPQGITNDNGEDFASTHYFDENQANIEEAKKLLAEAGYPNGEGIPTLSFMFNTEGAHKLVAQAIQQDWAKIGVNVKLENQEWKVFLSTRKEGGYEIARDGWSGDYVDPMTFLDTYVSDSGNNNSGYSNPKYDELVNAAKVEADVNKRWDMLKEAEDILMEDMPVIPLYYYTKPKAMKPEVKGVRVSLLGHVFFDNAYIEQ